MNSHDPPAKAFLLDIVYTTRGRANDATLSIANSQTGSPRAHDILRNRNRMNRLQPNGLPLICSVLLCLSMVGISRTVTGAENPMSPAQAIALAQKGRCREALPFLKKAMSQSTNKQAKYQAAMLTARCAMSLEDTESAVRALLVLNREFPKDPDV